MEIPNGPSGSMEGACVASKQFDCVAQKLTDCRSSPILLTSLSTIALDPLTISRSLRRRERQEYGVILKLSAKRKLNVAAVPSTRTARVAASHELRCGVAAMWPLTARRAHLGDDIREHDGRGARHRR